MSGTGTARFLPAVLTDKWTRARMAVLGGVDLVFRVVDNSFHLPQCGIFALQSQVGKLLLLLDGIASALKVEAAHCSADAHRRILNSLFSGRTASLIRWMKGHSWR